MNKLAILMIGISASLTAMAAAPQPTSEGDMHKGTVLEKLDAPGYTYLKIREASTEKWVAVPTTKVKVGEEIEFLKPLVMRDFYGKAVKKKFSEIYFASGLKGKEPARTKTEKPVTDQKYSGPSFHQLMASKDAEIKPGSIEKAKGGYTVAEIYEKKSELAGKSVSLRGKVTKVNRNIMNKNWVHVQDGTGVALRELVVLSKQDAKEGEVVLVSGKVGLNRNFGSGYSYPVILEDATFTASK